MAILPWIILLQLTTVLARGQAAHQSKPPSAPKSPEAMVRSLYREVVARRPIGIPEGGEMKVFAPYLSKTLLNRIGLAVACSGDWARQNPDPNLKPPFSALELGFFSGDNERATFRVFHIERTEQESDGSFRVYVRLTWGAPPEKPWIWHVVAIVVRENGRFVVDDVIYMKDEDLDVEMRLSEYLSYGCDGPRWVGHPRPPK